MGCNQNLGTTTLITSYFDTVEVADAAARALVNFDNDQGIIVQNDDGSIWLRIGANEYQLNASVATTAQPWTITYSTGSNITDRDHYAVISTTDPMQLPSASSNRTIHIINTTGSNATINAVAGQEFQSASSTTTNSQLIVNSSMYLVTLIGNGTNWIQINDA